MKKLAMTAAAGCAAVATVTATLGTTSASAAPPAIAAAKAPAVAWAACADVRLAAAKAECGMLQVPLDYTKPNGRKVSLAVSRLRATSPAATRQGPMLLNPGGPGGSGLRMPLYLGATLPKDVRATYDLIGFDPRGVGDSRPALSCDPNYNAGPRPDYVPAGDLASPLGANERAWLERSQSYAEACAKSNHALLPHLTTVNTVRDMDMLRRALGAQKINYYGFSYGTYLGQVYATMFPERVRRMVFDGNVDPTNVWYDAQLEQDEAFEVVMRAFFGWIAKHRGAYDLGATADEVAKVYSREQDELRGDPAGQIGPAEWTDVFLPAGYSQSLWPDIASAFAHWVRGETEPLTQRWVETAELGDDNGFAIYLGVQCVDASWPLSYATWRADGFDTASRAPFETWGNVWFNAPCMYWKAPQGVPVAVDGSRAPAPLLVNTTLDGATPFSGALTVRRLFPGSALVAEVGNTTHSNSLSGNACVDDLVFGYLRTGALPTRLPGSGPDVECEASPLPEPNIDDRAATVLPSVDADDLLRPQPGVAAAAAAAERSALVTRWTRAHR